MKHFKLTTGIDKVSNCEGGGLGDTVVAWDSKSICIQYVKVNREYFKPLAGEISEDTQKKGKSVKTGASHDWRSFYLSQYDLLKGSHMTKVVWLPNETDYSYCEFVAPKFTVY